MSSVEITVVDLKEAFPEWASYPDGYCQRFLTQATAYISTTNFKIRPEVRVLAIQYMAGHLITLASMDADGNSKHDGTAGSNIVSSSVDNVSISLQAPIAKDAFEQWIQSTPYGKAYWALLTANNPLGVYFVGNPRAFGIR